MDASPSAAVVRLAGDLSLRTCEAAHAQLLNAIAVHDEVVVDCSDAEEIDASLLQLLLAAQKTARAGRCRLRLPAPAGGALAEALVRAGLVDPDHPDPFWAAAGGEPR